MTRKPRTQGEKDMASKEEVQTIIDEIKERVSKIAELLNSDPLTVLSRVNSYLERDFLDEDET